LQVDLPYFGLTVQMIRRCRGNTCLFFRYMLHKSNREMWYMLKNSGKYLQFGSMYQK